MSKFKLQYLFVIIFPLLGSLISGILQTDTAGTGGLSLLEISLGLGLFIGIMTLFVRYMESKYYYVPGFLLAAIFAALELIQLNAPISIFPMLMMNLAYGFVIVLMIRYIFYIKTLFRLRTLLFGAAGGLTFSLYLAGIYSMISIPLPDGFWNLALVYGLILHVFIGFALSMADLLILRIEVAQMKRGNKSENDQ